MSDQVVQIILAVVTTAGVLLGGAFGKKWLETRAAGSRERTRADADDRARRTKAETAKEDRQFANDDEARRWLSGQLTERDRELALLLDRERELLNKVGELSAHVAQLAERSESQALQIAELRAAVAKWNEDYDKMEAERDAYRSASHTAKNELASESLKRQLAERELVARDQEIDRLKGVVDGLSKRDGAP